MRKSGGREKEKSPVHQGAPHGKFHSGLSSSELDEKDFEMLVLAADGPTTLLHLSEKMDIFFVECLGRARKLRGMGLLKRIETPHRSDGMNLYVTTSGKVDAEI